MFKASGMDRHVVALIKAKYRRGEVQKVEVEVEVEEEVDAKLSMFY